MVCYPNTAYSPDDLLLPYFHFQLMTQLSDSAQFTQSHFNQTVTGQRGLFSFITCEQIGVEQVQIINGKDGARKIQPSCVIGYKQEHNCFHTKKLLSVQK